MVLRRKTRYWLISILKGTSHMTTYTSKPINLAESGVLIAVQLCAPSSVTAPLPIDTVAEINTSAMYTYIQEGVATSLGLKPIDQVKITAATRLVYEGYMYRIRLVFPGGGAVEVNAVEVPYMIRRCKRIKCVIGRDILQRCILTYDGRANAVTLNLQFGS
jgi:hypothetical protein